MACSTAGFVTRIEPGHRHWIWSCASPTAREKLFVDYAGQGIPVVDGHSGEVHEVAIFVAVLGASHYTYAEADRDPGSPRLDRLPCPDLCRPRRRPRDRCPR